MDGLEQDLDRGRAHFQETLGNLPEPIRAMMQYTPEVFAGYLKFREGIYKDGGEGHLDLKTKEMLYTLLDIVTHNLDGAKNHGAAAQRAGMTSNELAEACMIAMHVCGVTVWGRTGWKVVDHIAELERDAAQQPQRAENAAT